MSSFESLEQRRLLAGDGVWTITGTDAGESITIDLRASDQRLRTIVNGQVVSTRLLRGLGLIEISANGGNDTIKIDLHDANPGLGIWVNGGPGRDRIYGGAGDENLGGGSGRDVVEGGRGNDIVRGGTDRDDCSGGDGDDYVQGNAGNDTLSGGWGDDRITGATGVDQIRGGNGADRIAGGKDADVLKGGADNDLIEAGGGVGNTVYRQLSGVDQTVTGDSDHLMTDESDEPLERVQEQDDLKRWLIERAVTQWKGTFGQEVLKHYWAEDGGAIFHATSAGSLASVVTANSLSTADTSQTNTQEAGVDEADIVETDGNYLYILHNDELVIADADPAADIKIVSRTKLGGTGSGIYLDGDRVTVLSSLGGFYTYFGGGGASISVASWGGDVIAPGELVKAQVQVSVFDVSDRANPSAVSTTKLDGSLTDSHVIDGRLYLVIQNYLSVPTPLTTKTADDKEVYESEAAYRARLEAGGVDEMIPAWTSDAAGAASGSLLHAPDAYVRVGDRLDTTSITLMNLRSASPAPIANTSVVGAQGRVYASQDNLYLAGANWEPNSTSPHTEFFKFNLGIDQVSLAASGKVQGTVLNQFSMDEEGEFFRVATNRGQRNLDWSNAVTVLDQVGDDLNIVGEVKDIGLDEQIFSARFIGDRGYVITFRQTDPLFTIDLSEPTAPKVLGELVIPGFSNYLHPVGEDHLIGLGQSGDRELQVSLFNVSDPTKPTRVGTYEFDYNTGSIANYDHHAFTYFADQGVLALPTDRTLTVLKVDLAEGFTKLGTIDHGDSGFAMRTVRIGENLFSIGNDAVRVHALDELGEALAVLQLPEYEDAAP